MWSKGGKSLWRPPRLAHSFGEMMKWANSEFSAEIEKYGGESKVHETLQRCGINDGSRNEKKSWGHSGVRKTSS